MQFFLCMGFLIPFTYGPGASYRELIAVAAAVPLMCALIFAWVPESPYHLLNKNKKQEALESLQWLRGYPERILMQSEITDILVSLCEIIFLGTKKSQICLILLTDIYSINEKCGCMFHC